MRNFLVPLALALMVSLCTVGVTQAANPNAPCIGENASTFAPVLRRDFGQVIVAPEAQAGLTGGVASTNAQTECTVP